MERGLSPRGAQAGGADTLQVQDPTCQGNKFDTYSSIRSQDSAYVSCYGSAEDLRDPKDGSGTEHTEHRQLLESAEHEQGADDSLLEQRESWPGDGIGEESQDSQDGAATKGTELSQVQDPAGHHWRGSNGESEIRPRKGKAVVKVSEESQDPQDGSATKGTELPQAQDPAGHRQGEAAALLEQSQSCPGDGTGEESQDGSAMGQPQKKTFRGFLSNLFRSHPLLTLAVLALLLALVVSLVSALAAVSGRTQTEIPFVRDTPLLLACPKGWVGYRGICYFFSKDHRSWDQAQAQCSELGASLAVLKDWEMGFLSCLSRNVDHWLGLRKRGRWLQWVDGSRFSSSVPVLGNAECVFLADDELRSGSCSNEMPYLCSRPQTAL